MQNRAKRDDDGELETEREPPIAAPPAGRRATASGSDGGDRDQHGDREKARQLAQDVMRARQVEREQHVEALVVEFARDADEHVDRGDEDAGEPRAGGIKPGLKSRALGDRDGLDEEAGRQQREQRDEDQRRQGGCAAPRAACSARWSRFWNPCQNTRSVSTTRNRLAADRRRERR